MEVEVYIDTCCHPEIHAITLSFSFLLSRPPYFLSELIAHYGIQLASRTLTFGLPMKQGLFCGGASAVWHSLSRDTHTLVFWKGEADKISSTGVKWHLPLASTSLLLRQKAREQARRRGHFTLVFACMKTLLPSKCQMQVPEELFLRRNQNLILFCQLKLSQIKIYPYPITVH